MSGPAVVERTGHQHGAWTITGRNRDRARGTYWDATCSCGRTGVLFAGDIARGLCTACRFCSHPRTGRSYRTAHRNVERAKGKAKSYTCTDCTEQADQWSYDHADPDELIDKKTGCAYSLKVEHYGPRCTSDHRAFDERRKAVTS